MRRFGQIGLSLLALLTCFAALLPSFPAAAEEPDTSTPRSIARSGFTFRAAQQIAPHLPAGSGLPFLLGGLPDLGWAAAQRAPAFGRPPNAAELDRIQTIAQRIEHVRGLAFRNAVDARLMTRAEFQRWFQERLEVAGESADFSDANLLWTLLGLIPEGLDLGQTYAGFYGSQVIGLYAARERRLYVLDDGSGTFGPLAEVTVAHELVHALQDQYFNLAGFQRLPETATSDESLARAALVEGDALYSEVLYVRRHFTRQQIDELLASDGGGDGSALSRTPQILIDILVFPYTSGPRWVQALHNLDGWVPVNGAFLRPPQSTGEILHPDRYLDGVAPNRPDLPDLARALGRGWEELATDGLGELIWRSAVKEYLGATRATAATQGFAGDTIALLRHQSGAGLLAARIEFDDETQAGQFFAASAQANETRFGADALITNFADYVIFGGSPAVLLERRGSSVILAFGPTIADVETAARAIP